MIAAVKATQARQCAADAANIASSAFSDFEGSDEYHVQLIAYTEAPGGASTTPATVRVSTHVGLVASANETKPDSFETNLLMGIQRSKIAATRRLGRLPLHPCLYLRRNGGSKHGCWKGSCGPMLVVMESEKEQKDRAISVFILRPQ